jgi:hypothetical protein
MSRAARAPSTRVARVPTTRASTSRARASAMRDVAGVYAVSDVHVDHEKNAAWVRALRRRDDVDVACVCGDVSDDLDALEETLEGFKRAAFAEVFYTFGNHELWLGEADETRGTKDSKAKIEEVFAMCARIGVQTSPMKVCDGLWIAPVHSYHHKAFDTEPEVAEAVPPVERVMNDFRFSKWPDGMDDRDSDDVARYCDSLNDAAAWETFLRSIERGDRVVSFSHFLPRLELLPEKRMLFYPKLAQASGSVHLRKRVEEIKSRINDGDMTHVFGHTHFGWNTQIDGVRYVQASLATPKEWQKRPRSLIIGNWTNAQPEPMCVYTKARSLGVVDDAKAMWSEYYAKNRRTPEDVELAPHAREFVQRRWGDRRLESNGADAPLPGATGRVK